MAANAWANPSMAGSGARATCDPDEDSVTMAVAATRSALAHSVSRDLKLLAFASTTPPFLDRQNATIVGEALSLPGNLQTADFTGSQRAGTSALLLALQSNHAKAAVAAADRPITKCGSTRELVAGDGAAAVLVGGEDLLATFVGSCSRSLDLVDHYRSTEARFDYQLEERWVREEGFFKVIPEAVGALLAETGVDATRIRHFAVGGVDDALARSIADRCGIAKENAVSSLRRECGEPGCAHPLLLLQQALQQAEASDYVLLVGFGQGCDALLFQATGRVHAARGMFGPAAAIDRQLVDADYARFLSGRNLLEMDWGLRAERDNRTALSAHLRHRRSVTAFVGGRCTACGATQFPKTPVCVNEACHRRDCLVDETFADKPGVLRSFTEDWLAHTPSPPFRYGNVGFEGGAVVMMEITDAGPAPLEVGARIQPVFRIKDRDANRAFHRYFWKASVN